MEHPPTLEECTTSNSKVCTLNAVTNFLQENFNQVLLNDSIPVDQKVMVAKFFITTSGKVIRPIVLGKNKTLKTELIRVIKTLPTFKPGMVDGKPVNAMINLPVKFFKKDSLTLLAFKKDKGNYNPAILKSCTKNINPKECTSKKVMNVFFKNANLRDIHSTQGNWLRAQVSFSILKDGSITNIRAEGINEKLNKEAVRLVKKLDGFIPATLDGVPVKSQYQIPLSLKVD